MSETVVNIDTTPVRIDYTHKKGDTWTSDPITVYDGGTAVNFTGATATFTWSYPLSGATAFSITSASGRITLSSGGVITKTMTAAESAALAAGEYKTNLVVTYSNNTIQTIEEGYFNHKG